MEDKIGVFICTGYGIAEALDVDGLCTVATDEYGVPFCSKVDTCEGAGLQAIKEDIEREELTKVIIAGISPRCYSEDGFPPDIIVEKIGLRDQVVWTQPAGEEDTQMLAEDYLRMYLARIDKMTRPEPVAYEEEVNRSVLVVGGGITGITAALGAAEAGYPVRLVEKDQELGGWLARQHQSVPTRAPFRELEDPGISDLISSVEANPLVEIYTSAATSEISGGPGFFDVTLKSVGNGEDSLDSFRVGSIIQATGWRPRDPRGDLPYGSLEDVILNVDLEKMIKEEGKIVRPSDGSRVNSIAFIQCGGSTRKEHHSYCSSICCLTSLKQALYLRQSDEESKAFIFYEFIRTPGHYEDFYRRVQEDPGVFLTKGEVEEITRESDGRLCLTVSDSMIGERIQVGVDLVVLAAGMIPNSADGEALRILEDSRVKAAKGESEKERKDAAESVDRLREHDGTEILNLTYRQGPDLPILEYGFPDSHFICFPYESRRTGIYPAGCVRQPMDGLASREDGTGAALKAIQCIEMTSRGEAVHPRAGDNSFPDFFLQRCTQCKRCTEECPFGVLNEDVKGTPLLQVTRCRRCGICMGACPERIISFEDYSVNIVASMIKAVHVPDEFDEKPRVLVLACENDAFPAIDLAGQHGVPLSSFMRVIPVRCLGSVNSVWVTEAMSAGYDGVILLGCKYGDDYQCHFVKGSELASTRQKNVREKLEQMAMENERVELHEVQISDYERVSKIFSDFEELIEEIGLNPFKGM